MHTPKEETPKKDRLSELIETLIAPQLYELGVSQSPIAKHLGKEKDWVSLRPSCSSSRRNGRGRRRAKMLDDRDV